MEKLTDESLVKELLKRLEAKDKANHDLVVITRKLEKLNEKLLESEKVKSSFLSNIRNEINNPLTSVLTLCELVINKDGVRDYDTIYSIVNTVHKEAFNLNFQLRNIFAAAELEAGESVISVSTVDMRSLIESAIGSFQHKLAEKKLKVVFKPQDDVTKDPHFSTDAEKIQLVLYNLLSNAIEFSFEGKIVEVKAWKKHPYFFITITDEGAGIEDAKKDQIFERFKQLDTGLTKRHGGHGLGLSITKAALELLGGSIALTSKQGQGASFTVSVPEMSAQGASAVFSDDGNDFFFDSKAGEVF